MGSNIIAFNKQLPTPEEWVVGDCCFIHDYLWLNSTDDENIDLISKKRLGEVKKFSTNLIKNRNIVIIPPILRTEMIKICESRIMGQDSPETKKMLFKNNKKIEEVYSTFEQIEDAIKNDPLFYIDDENPKIDLSKIKQIQLSNNLKFNDATYVYYTKEHYNLKSIVTVDKDFTRMQDTSMNLYVDSRTFEFYERNKPLTNNIGQMIVNAYSKKEKPI